MKTRAAALIAATTTTLLTTLTAVPVSHAVPCGDDCGNPYFDPNNPKNAQFLQQLRAIGINGTDHSLISGALNTVCPEAASGEPGYSITAALVKYAGYTRFQAGSYLIQSVNTYCPQYSAKY